MGLLNLLAHREWEKRFKQELEDELQMVFISEEEAEVCRGEYEIIKYSIQQTSYQIEEEMELMRN